MARPLLSIISRLGPVLGVLAAAEATLFVALYCSATLQDLYRTPALIALVVGLVAAGLRLRPRRGADRRGAPTRRRRRGPRRERTAPGDGPPGVHTSGAHTIGE